MLTDVSQRYSRQYSYHVFHYTFKFNENFPFRIFFFILNSSRLFFFLLLLLFLFSIHCCWKSLFLYCVNLIEFILRDVTGCHSLEFLNGIGNEESVPLKIALAIRCSTFSQELFGRSWLYVIVIYEYLGHVELFMRSMQFVSTLFWFCASPYEPSNWSVCFKYLKLEDFFRYMKIHLFALRWRDEI